MTTPTSTGSAKAKWFHTIVFLSLTLLILWIIINYKLLISAQHFYLRIVMGLAAAGLAALIPGFFDLSVKWFENSLKVGGAIGVFALIYLVDPGTINTSNPCYTDYDLRGKWSIVAITSKDSVRNGIANIDQLANSCIIQIHGEFDNPVSGKPKTVFNSTIGQINGRELKIMYENTNGEKGSCEGKINRGNLNEMQITYRDLFGMDKNDDPYGTMTLTRISE